MMNNVKKFSFGVECLRENHLIFQNIDELDKFYVLDYEDNQNAPVVYVGSIIQTEIEWKDAAIGTAYLLANKTDEVTPDEIFKGEENGLYVRLHSIDIDVHSQVNRLLSKKLTPEKIKYIQSKLDELE